MWSHFSPTGTQLASDAARTACYEKWPSVLYYAAPVQRFTERYDGRAEAASIALHGLRALNAIGGCSGGVFDGLFAHASVSRNAAFPCHQFFSEAEYRPSFGQLMQ
jgi:hypothetical protein